MVDYQIECQELVKEHADIVVVDGYDERGLPLFAIRIVNKAIGMKSGKTSYWGVAFDDPLTDGSNAVAYNFILAYSTSHTTNSDRLMAYHPSWTLTPGDEIILTARKQRILESIDELV